jgi:hypothetical protein
LTFAASTSEKTAIYQKFFKVTGTETQYKQMRQLLVSQFTQGLLAGISRAISKNGAISDADKVEVKKLTNDFVQDATKRMFESYDKELPFSDLVKNVFMPTYEKHFTLAEIKEITAFYQRPLGQKFVKLAPTMMHETVGRMSKMYGQTLHDISLKVLKEEMGKFKLALDKIVEKRKKEKGAAKPTT